MKSSYTLLVVCQIGQGPSICYDQKQNIKSLVFNSNERNQKNDKQSPAGLDFD